MSPGGRLSVYVTGVLLCRQVDGRTSRGLRRLSVYVTEEWLWKLGAARFSAFGRPGVDELDTVGFMKDLQSRYLGHRTAASTAAHSPDIDFRPFIIAVNEVRGRLFFISLN